MTNQEKEKIIRNQRAFYQTGVTNEIQFRITALKKLYKAIRKHEPEIRSALQEDLGKSRMESFMCEIGLTLSEISYMLRHVRRFAAPRRVPTPITNFAATSVIRMQPYGNVLIMSPWNYPFLLTMEPLVDAIAAGNTAVIKPSAYSPATSAVMEKIIREVFPARYVAVITGGREENAFLLKEKFDYIFFTGSQNVGKEVLKAASAHLTPVTLELGGKSPCIVDATADIALAARRIVWGKFLNCGQTCVAPDYLYCDESVKDELIEAIGKEITRQFGRDPLSNKNYGKIINEKHLKRLLNLMDPEKVVIGGRHEEENRRIEPTVMDRVTFEDPVMQEEIFGPILPVLTFKTLREAVAKVEAGEHPLALYFFSQNERSISAVTENVRFGGGCINDVVVHLATSNMPFGGFGESGMGCYHGKEGFMTFSHQKSIMDKKTWIDLPMRYQPYKNLFEKMMRTVLH